MQNAEKQPVKQEHYAGHEITITRIPGDAASSTSAEHPAYRLFIDGKVVPRKGSPSALVHKARSLIDQRAEDLQILPRLVELIDGRRSPSGLSEIGQVTEGDIVWVLARGHWRCGLVTKIARVRVTVSYTTYRSMSRVFHKVCLPRDLRRDVGRLATSAGSSRPPAQPADHVAAGTTASHGPSQHPEDTEQVAFEDLKVNDVLVRGCGDGRRARVLRPAEDFTDPFGRAMRQYWCGAMDGTAKEGWVPYGPGGTTLRLQRDAVEADFRSAMDDLGKTQESVEALAPLVRRAAQYFVAARAHGRFEDASEHLVVAMEAAAVAATCTSTLASLALRVRQLWSHPLGSHQGAAVGCLPRDAADPMVLAALRVVREAGITMAVLPDKIRPLWSWDAEFGSDGSQGALVWSSGSSLTVEWIMGGRSGERCLTRSQVPAVREVRNLAFAQLEEVFRDAGWNVATCGSTNTRTRRVVSLQVGCTAAEPS
ncbi:hypothetical protein [Streptomyces sp. NPDC015125]|uniref:hypothetical protein n=1 Tax=Streptomyces sp. NPDC015125 TaxID=3364938 RepID=UPI00370313C1